MRIRLDSFGSWMSEAAASLFGRESVLLEPIPGQAHWQDCSRGGGLVRGLKATMAQLPAPTPEEMSEDALHYNTRWEEHQIWTAGSTLQNARHFQYSTSGTCGYETYGKNIKRMQDSEVNFLRWTYWKRVSRALNSKNRKAQVFPPGTDVYYWRKDKR